MNIYMLKKIQGNIFWKSFPLLTMFKKTTKNSDWFLFFLSNYEKTEFDSGKQKEHIGPFGLLEFNICECVNNTYQCTPISS